MDELETITIVDESGEQKDVQLLFSYTDEETDREYLLFGDEQDDESINAYVFYRDPDTPEDTLQEIESDEEYERVTAVLDALLANQ